MWLTLDMAKRENRTPDFNIKFTHDASQNVTGWFFAVPVAFRDALDIKYTVRKSSGRSVWDWTRGKPPQIAFDLGDVFYDQPDARRGNWDRASRQLTFAISVRAAASDRLSNGKIVPGAVEFDLFRFEDGRIQKTDTIKTTQREFMNFLKSGKIPGIVDLTLKNENSTPDKS